MRWSESAKSLLDARGVRERVELVPGSFFDAVPSGADVYVLKTVLHDWDDERSMKILGVVRSAMKPGARLVLVDFIVEAECDHFGVMIDVHMMVVCGEGRERSRGDFERLLEATGFRTERMLTTSTGMGIVEGVAVEQTVLSLRPETAGKGRHGALYQGRAYPADSIIIDAVVPHAVRSLIGEH